MNALYVEEFAANIFWALSNDPRPLTSEQRYALSWEAAMERFENAALITMDQRPHLQALDGYLASAIEMVRQRCILTTRASFHPLSYSNLSLEAANTETSCGR